MAISIDLSPYTALICGASQGIGWETAQLFAQAGAKVILLARNTKVLRERIGELAYSSRHSFLTCDFSNHQSLVNLCEEIKTLDLDILVHNTGGPPPGNALEAAAGDYHKAIDMHLISLNMLAQAVVPQMVKRGHGRIVNLVSVSAKMPSEYLAVSSAVRAAVVSYSKNLSNLVAKDNITVNSILTGYTNTSRIQDLIKSNAHRKKVSEDEIMQNLIAKIPIRRLAEPEEIAQAVLFLASPLASYITGAAIEVDGGYGNSLF